MGPRSLMVMDGKQHQQERRQLLPVFSPERLAQYERTMQQAAVNAVGEWPQGQGLDLWPLVEHALEAMNLALAVGASPESAGKLLRLTRRARQRPSGPRGRMRWRRRCVR